MISVTLEKSCNQKPVQSLVLLTERKGQNSQKQSGTCRNSKKIFPFNNAARQRETKQKSLSSKISISLLPSFLYTSSLAASCSLVCTEFSSQLIQILQVRNFAWFRVTLNSSLNIIVINRQQKKNMLMTNKQL